jgi:hypothetical protein
MLTANGLGNPIESLIGIYQPFYKPSLIERLDAGFIPLDWMSNPTPALRELALHRYIAEDKLFAKHRLQERYAAVTSTAVGQELLASDPVDYDLPKFHPKSVMTPHDKRRGAVTG